VANIAFSRGCPSILGAWNLAEDTTIPVIVSLVFVIHARKTISRERSPATGHRARHNEQIEQSPATSIEAPKEIASGPGGELVKRYSNVAELEVNLVSSETIEPIGRTIVTG
jgi:hypothetical protein